MVGMLGGLAYMFRNSLGVSAAMPVVRKLLLLTDRGVVVVVAGVVEGKVSKKWPGERRTGCIICDDDLSIVILTVFSVSSASSRFFVAVESTFECLLSSTSMASLVLKCIDAGVVDEAKR